jgi:metallo-beta-lactamase family protein
MRTDILFVGYQAKDTIGQKLQKHSPQNWYVQIDKNKYSITARVEPISDHPAHVGQDNHPHFIKGTHKNPSVVRLVHGEPCTQESLREKIRAVLPEIAVARGSEYKGELP